MAVEIISDDDGLANEAMRIANAAISLAKVSANPLVELALSDAALAEKTVDHVAPAPATESPLMPYTDAAMSMTREELMAHLDAQQARTEAMLARQGADTERHLSRFEARIDSSLQQMRDDRQDQKADAKSTRNTIYGSVLAIFLALFGAVYAINSMNSSIIGNVIAAFEAGKSATAPPVEQPKAAASATGK